MDVRKSLGLKAKSASSWRPLKLTSGVFLVFMAGSVGAASMPIESQQVTAGADPVIVGSLWQLMLGLAVVLGAIAAAAWLLRRFGRVSSAIGGIIKIVGGVSMGPRERVVLLQVGNTQLLLGVTPGRIQSLHVLDEPVPACDINTDTHGFAGRLAAAIRLPRSA